MTRNKQKKKKKKEKMHTSTKKKKKKKKKTQKTTKNPQKLSTSPFETGAAVKRTILLYGQGS